MLDNVIAVNEALIRQFNKTATDIPEDELFHPSVGHGHPPVWILGHLAIVGEQGQKLLGGSITHREWLPLFGMGSSDIVASSESLTRNSLTSTVNETYQTLRSLAAAADESSLSGPLNIEFFEGTPIKTIGQCVSLILTSHFGFHLAQLSCCRRTAGFGPLF